MTRITLGPEDAIPAVLTENKVLVSDPKLRDQLHQQGFGDRIDKDQVIDLFEALFLVSRDKLPLFDLKNKPVSEKTLLRVGLKWDETFYTKYLAFNDLRDRGYVVRTGLKFGFHFRVYPKGKKPGEEHTYWVVNVCTQDDLINMPDFSRMVRLAGNIHTLLLQAVVDSENDINYYEVRRVTP